jgi:hypothetical protein
MCVLDADVRELEQTTVRGYELFVDGSKLYRALRSIASAAHAVRPI